MTRNERGRVGWRGQRAAGIFVGGLFLGMGNHGTMRSEILESASLLLQAFPLYMFVVVAALAACLPRAPGLRLLLLAMLASVLANQALKALLRRPRPAPWSCGHVPRWGRDAATATSGMPSGHVQLMATVATVLALLAWTDEHSDGAAWRRGLVLAAGAGAVALMAVSRTAAGHAWGLHPLGRPNPRGCHTPAQAGAGALAGALVGAAVFWSARRA